MPRAQWTLKHGRPTIEIVLTNLESGQKTTRTLLADTGAGKATDAFEFLLEESDCLLCGGAASYMISLGGAYKGWFPVYLMPIEIPALRYADDCRVVGVPTPPKNLDGIAAFMFLNRFTYGNFGNPAEFGLET